MSQPFKVVAIVRCPLCHDGKQPIHVGLGVMLCECCGNRFRVVHANPGRTGKKLDMYLRNKITFKSTK